MPFFGKQIKVWAGWRQDGGAGCSCSGQMVGQQMVLWCLKVAKLCRNHFFKGQKTIHYRNECSPFALLSKDLEKRIPRPPTEGGAGTVGFVREWSLRVVNLFMNKWLRQLGSLKRLSRFKGIVLGVLWGIKHKRCCVWCNPPTIFRCNLIFIKGMLRMSLLRWELEQQVTAANFENILLSGTTKQTVWAIDASWQYAWE